MNYYQHNIGDFANDTKLMTFEQKGIYVDMLDRYASTGMPLGSQWVTTLKRVAGEEAVDTVLSLCFEERDGFYHHERMDKLLADYEKMAEKNRANGRKRAAKSPKTPANTEEEQIGSQSVASGNPVGSLTNNHKPLTNNQYINKVSNDTLSAEQETPVVLEPKNPVQRLASHCPHEKLISLYQQEMPQNPVVRSWNSPARKNSMQARWRAIVTDKKFETEAEGLEWFRRFFEYCNRSSFLRGDSTPTADGRTFIADLEWLMKPSNFDKVIDGKYHH